MASMKQSLRQEKLRHQLDVRSVKAELLEVSEEQAAAHQQLGGIVPGGAKAMAQTSGYLWQEHCGQGLVSDGTWRRLCRGQCPHHHTPKPLAGFALFPCQTLQAHRST